ncbi:hypothetical protein PMAYCL1PPCAC_09672, partial [Pristionchus mayeri]
FQMCEWRGLAPHCGSNDCPEGSTEIARVEQSIDSIPEFGPSCSFGTKTLCCLSEAVRKDPERGIANRLNLRITVTTEW